MRKHTLSIAVAALAIAAAPVAAQAPADLSAASLDELLSMHVDQVYTASRSIEDVRRAPSAVTIVSGDEIKRFGFRTLADVLRSATGFYTTYDRNYTYLGVRGFGLPGDYNSRVLVLIDGFRFNDGIYNEALIAGEFPVNVALIDRVEIIRGPSSSLYGSNAFFAVVNVMTVRGRAMRHVEAQVEAGTLGTSTGRVSAGGRAGGAEFLVSEALGASNGVQWPQLQQSDGVRGAVFSANPDRETTQNGLAKISAGGFSFGAGWSSRTKRVPTGSFGTIFGDPALETVDGSFFAHAEYGRTLPDKTEISIRASFDATRYRGTYPYANEDGSRYLDHDGARGNAWSTEALLARHLGARNTISVGTELRRDITLDQYYSYDPPMSGGPDFDSNHSLFTWGAFGQDEIAVGDNLLVNAGGRVDRYESFGTTFNPRLGVIFGPSRPTTLKLVYGRAFRAPTPYEQFYYRGQGPLRPETNATIEGIWEQRIGRLIRTSIAVYRSRIDDLILQENTNGDSQMSGLLFANLSNVKARGVDSSIEVRWRAGALVRAGYSYVDVDDLQTRSDLSNMPWNLTKLAAIVPLWRNATAAFDSEYVGVRKTVSGGLLDGHWRQNACLTVPFRAFEARLSIANLFDARYADPVGEEISSGAIVQDGRTAMLSLTYRLR